MYLGNQWNKNQEMDGWLRHGETSHSWKSSQCYFKGAPHKIWPPAQNKYGAAHHQKAQTAHSDILTMP